MKYLFVCWLATVYLLPASATWPHLASFLTQKNKLYSSDRVDNVNTRIWPFTGLLSGITGQSDTDSTSQNNGDVPTAPPAQSSWSSYFAAPNIFEGLTPFFQNLFDSSSSSSSGGVGSVGSAGSGGSTVNTPADRRDWWKGNNICITREEIDENAPSTPRPDGDADADDAAGIEDIELEVPLGDIVDDDEVAEGENPSASRLKRELFYNSTLRISSCSDKGLAYVCETKVRTNTLRKRYLTKYSCCFGTTRERGEMGCHPVEMHSLQETVFALGGRSFMTLLKEANIEDSVTSQNHTYFVPVDRSRPPPSLPSLPSGPSDSANTVNVLDGKTPSDAEDALLRARRQITFSLPSDLIEKEAQHQEANTVVRAHMARGLHLTTDFIDEQLLDTEDGESKIRINLYNTPDRIYTANCVRLVSTNHFSSEGVVHMLNGVMKPAVKTIAQLLEDEPHFSSFRHLLSTQNMDSLDQPGKLTVFAPTDDAFAKMDPEDRERLMKGHGCATSVVKHHILGNVICSTVIEGRARSTTLLGSSLLLENDLGGKLYVNGKQVITRDVVATNGVLHVIDGVLVPENARTFTQLLYARNLTEMARLVETAGLGEALDSLGNTTLLAPTNEAIRAVPDAVKQSWVSDPDRLKQVLSHHIIQPQVHQSTLSDNQLVPTDLQHHKLRFNFHQSMPFFNAVPMRATVQCATIVRWEQEACNGNVHTVDRVLIPANNSITEFLAANRSFSIMTQLLKMTKLDEILSSEGPFTVLAAPDVAFYQIAEEMFAEIMDNPVKAAEIMKQHIVPEHICCAGFRGDWFSTNRRKTLDGFWMPLQRHLDGSISAGEASVNDCDQLANNGVIHVVDKVILSRTSPIPFLTNTRRVGLGGIELIFKGGK